MQTPKIIDTKEAVYMIKDWHRRRPNYPPRSELVELIELLEAEGETTTYNKAIQIMTGIKTTKMHGWANHGWGYFQDQWWKMARHES